MVSRRKILSRSRDDLRLEIAYQQIEDEEDVWYQKEKFFKDHIQEVFDKWKQIDDEIWAKIIVLERNRRVAKAYARAPVLTVNGSNDGFDGFRIGLNGFENPMRDLTTEELKKHIGQGVKIKMDDAGNILIKRVSKCNIYVKATNPDENAIGNDILKSSNQVLELDKPLKLFDMKKFQANVNKEMKKAYPDRKRLEYQSLSIVAFVKSEIEILQCPIWILIINIVAMDMLKAKLPLAERPIDIRNRPKIPIPDEDPYSVAGNGASSNLSINSFQKRADKPPKLPPREHIFPQNIPKPDYDDLEDQMTFKRNDSVAINHNSKDKATNKKHDDPYYCGLRARVPNFVKMLKPKEGISHKQTVNQYRNYVTQKSTLHHSKSYDQGIDMELVDSPYNQIYGRLPIPTRTFIPNQYQKKQMYIGEWD